MIVLDDTPLEERELPTRGGLALLTTCPTSGARYLYLDKNTRGQAGIVERTEEITKGNVCFDYDQDGKLIGIEIY